MIPLIGYADRLSVRPGETIAFKVSSVGPGEFSARLVRVMCSDPNPAGPGILEEPMAAAFAGAYPSRVQPIHLGSYARIKHSTPLNDLSGFTLLATIYPTTPNKGEQAILSRLDQVAGTGFALAIGTDGSATVMLGQGGGTFMRLSVGIPLRERRWYRVWATYDPLARQLSVAQLPLHDNGFEQEGSASQRVERLAGGAGDLLIAAMGSPVSAHFNGKIEAPALYDRALTATEITAAVAGATVPGLIAHWDFSREISSTRIIDIGPQGLHGELVNLPARAMTGSNWSAREMCWRHTPETYGAIHFHEDDIDDAGWSNDFSFTVPDDCRSGVYAVRLRCGEHEDSIPFFVCPPKGRRQADLCVLIPTFTYTIYGNHARPDFSPAWRRRTTEWGAYPWNPAEHPEYGLSTYNVHTDGSGICHASSLRPLLTLKSGFITFAKESDSGLRHFQADSHLWAWLEQQGYTFDVVTDLELHQEGVDVIAGYRSVLTGTHPEYHTAETLDALEHYRDAGGRLVYLGGNGFYWRVAVHAELPGVLEIRRGEGGIRAWAAEPGEYYNSFDGAYGGLWRRSARPPQRLVGTGFSAQGTFEGSYYRRTAASHDPQVAWIFDGVEDEILGDFGLSGGGAAGFELDRADPRLGTPEHAVVVARSEGHSANFILVPEEQLTHITTLPGEPAQALIRADMVFFTAPNGGAVFSVSSITFCGSLLHHGGDNNISRILANVLDRFLDSGVDFR